MKRFLILGHEEDLHAHYVTWALQRAGYDASLVNSAHDNCPARTTLYLDNLTDDFGGADWNNVEAAWCRRLLLPSPSDESKGEDVWYAYAEEQRFTRWLIDLQTDDSIRWINFPGAALAAENKFVQLRTARSHGITVPRTLVTAEPDRVRSFLKTEGTVVVKPLYPYTWEYASGVMLTSFANLLDEKRASELSDEDIAQCVTIYQQRIDKVADIRMLIMGRDIFGYKVLQKGEQHFDFRIGFLLQDHLRYEQMAVPGSLKKKILELMDSMKINFASADFALTSEGDFVFLDLNPSGQWLFLKAPGAEVGQKFCSFFVKGRVDPAVERQFPSYSDFMDSDSYETVGKKAFHEYGNNAGPISGWKEARV